jgi:hypothetical protein
MPKGCLIIWGSCSLAQAGKGMVRSERIDSLHGDRVSLSVVKRDGNQEEHRQQRNNYDKVSNHGSLVSLSRGWLEDYGTLDGLAHVGMMSLFYICDHWNLHWAPSFLSA